MTFREQCLQTYRQKRDKKIEAVKQATIELVQQVLGVTPILRESELVTCYVDGMQFFRNDSALEVETKDLPENWFAIESADDLGALLDADNVKIYPEYIEAQTEGQVETPPKTEKCFIIGLRHYCFRYGKPAEIIGVQMVTPDGDSPDGCPPRACFHVLFPDGKEDWIPVSDSAHYSLTTEGSIGHAKP